MADQMTPEMFMNFVKTASEKDIQAQVQTAGVDPCRIVSLGVCTAETTDRFFSYRAAAGPTGRHCALACVLSPSS